MGEGKESERVRMNQERRSSRHLKCINREVGTEAVKADLTHNDGSVHIGPQIPSIDEIFPEEHDADVET